MLGTGNNPSNVAKGQFPLARQVWIGTFCQIRADIPGTLLRTTGEHVKWTKGDSPLYSLND